MKLWDHAFHGAHGKQGMWTLFGEGGQVLKRGHELAGLLFPLERRLLKLVSD